MFCRQFSGELSVPHLIHNVGTVTKFCDLPATVHDDNALESGVSFRCAYDARERSEARARAQQEQVTTRQQIIRHQGTSRLGSQEKSVVDIQMLQTRCQRTVRDLDTEKLEMIVEWCTGHAVGAHQWFALELQSDHGELSGFEPKRWMARDNEAKQEVAPVPTFDN